MRWEIVDGEPVCMVEICKNCGKQPQAPSWDICFGCGELATPRIYVPARECIEYGRSIPLGYRWMKHA